MDSADNRLPQIQQYDILDRAYPVGSTFTHENDDLTPDQRLGFGVWQLIAVPSYFRLGGRSGATGSVPNATIWGCKFYVEEFDDYSLVTGAEIYTAPIDGVYYFSSNWSVEATTGTYRYALGLYINSSGFLRFFDGNAGGNSNTEHIGGSTTVQLSQGDTVKVIFYHAIGSTRTIYSTNFTDGDRVYFTGNLVGYPPDKFVWQRTA